MEFVSVALILAQKSCPFYGGGFPTLIAMISMFFVTSVGAGAASPLQSVLSAILLTGVIVFSVGMTFLLSRVLSATILKGLPSSFILELPPYRKPQIGKTIIRSVCDRTFSVLVRALSVAAPAGLVIWLLANSSIGGVSLLSHAAGFLDPFGRLLGMDGVILLAFILGLPANEIVIPIMIMAYLSRGTLASFDSLTALKTLLVSNGWTWLTAVSVMLFSLMHWPCSTTLMTIRKETESLKWTVVSFLVPTLTGIAICLIFATVVRWAGVV
ncbi:MAG: ferrous iron transporter B [Clostridiales bacterium]|jgi:ferrous iron transport protein B|nr:ferrous iron transporter B [Clostridiales bacterium]